MRRYIYRPRLMVIIVIACAAVPVIALVVLIFFDPGH